MNETSIGSQAPVPAVADLNWQIVAVADLNGDGKADLVWRHAGSGSNTIRRMNRTGVFSTAPLPPVSDNAWRLAGPR